MGIPVPSSSTTPPGPKSKSFPMFAFSSAMELATAVWRHTRFMTMGWSVLARSRSALVGRRSFSASHLDSSKLEPRTHWPWGVSFALAASLAIISSFVRQPPRSTEVRLWQYAKKCRWESPRPGSMTLPSKSTVLSAWNRSIASRVVPVNIIMPSFTQSASTLFPGEIMV